MLNGLTEVKMSSPNLMKASAHWRTTESDSTFNLRCGSLPANVQPLVDRSTTGQQSN